MQLSGSTTREYTKFVKYLYRKQTEQSVDSINLYIYISDWNEYRIDATTNIAIMTLILLFLQE